MLIHFLEFLSGAIIGSTVFGWLNAKSYDKGYEDGWDYGFKDGFQSGLKRGEDWRDEP